MTIMIQTQTGARISYNDRELPREYGGDVDRYWYQMGWNLAGKGDDVAGATSDLPPAFDRGFFDYIELNESAAS